MGNAIRTKFIDFDARREPKTDRWCVCCQKDLKPDAPVRKVYVGESMQAIHPADLKAYLDAPPSSIDIGPHLIGMNCARKLGLEWTVAP